MDSWRKFIFSIVPSGSFLRDVPITGVWSSDGFGCVLDFCGDHANCGSPEAPLHGLLLLRQIMPRWVGQIISLHVQKRIRKLQAWWQISCGYLGTAHDCSNRWDDRRFEHELVFCSDSRISADLHRFEWVELCRPQKSMRAMQGAIYLSWKWCEEMKNKNLVDFDLGAGGVARTYFELKNVL